MVKGYQAKEFHLKELRTKSSIGLRLSKLEELAARNIATPEQLIDLTNVRLYFKELCYYAKR